jgi:hypothetical protein
VGDLVKAEIEHEIGAKINLEIRHMQDFRNYKVSIDKAKNVLSFHPQNDVRAIVRQLIKEMDKFSDWDNPAYQNIQVFREFESSISNHALEKSVGAAR